MKEIWLFLVEKFTCKEFRIQYLMEQVAVYVCIQIHIDTNSVPRGNFVVSGDCQTNELADELERQVYYP